jgi:hypothetical protein
MNLIEQRGTGSNVYLYVESDATIELNGTDVSVSISGDYMWNGRSTITVTPSSPCACTLHLRIPGWSDSFVVRLNGTIVDAAIHNGYVSIRRERRSGDTCDLSFDMRVRKMQANPEVFEAARYNKTYRPLVALARGPLVYAVEAIDNGGTASIEIASDPEFETHYDPNFLGGITVVTGKTSDGELPYARVLRYSDRVADGHRPTMSVNTL